MSTVTAPTTTTTNSTAPPTTQTSADQARTQLSSNFDTFLKLLTAQLQNQDPLSPMDSTQFTQQLVEYSQVEQQIDTNSELTALSGTLTQQLQATSAGAAVSYIGKTAVFNSDALALGTGSNPTWTYTLPNAAANATVMVTDDSGNIVYAAVQGAQNAGDYSFPWNGKNAAGVAQPAGIYHLAVNATDASGAAITPSISVTEQITGADLSGTAPTVTTASGDREFSTIKKVTQ